MGRPRSHISNIPLHAHVLQLDYEHIPSVDMYASNRAVGWHSKQTIVIAITYMHP